MGNVVDLRARQSGKDRLLNIATGVSVSNNRVKNQRLTWAQMVEKFAAPVKTRETIKEYLAMPRETQDRIKDVGYFVPAHYEGNVRKKQNLGLKDLGTLDYDHAGENFLEEIKETFDGYEFVLYTTHKHTAARPRFRVVFLFSRPVDDAEYQAAMRKVAAMGCIDDTDDTTFQPSRVMHFGSHASDGEFVFEHVPGRMIDVDALLATYNDWKDISQWPLSSRVNTPLRQSGRKAQDPRQKTGIIGAFCTTYDIEAAIDKFLPGVYVEGSSPNRLTYSESTASNGAVLYDDGQFLYSNHESDPCGGKNVNSWDLVRLHLYGELDSKQPEDTAPSKLKSYEAMVLLAKADPDVKGAMLTERLHIEDDFADFAAEDELVDRLEDETSAEVSRAAATDTPGKSSPILDDDGLGPVRAAKPAKEKFIGAEAAIKAWGLKTNDFGLVPNSLMNVEKILDNDPRLKGCVCYNEFLSDMLQIRRIPGLNHNPAAYGSPWTDTAELALKSYMERVYGAIFPTTLIAEGARTISKKLSFDPVKDWMDSLIWDGTARLCSFLTETLGAEANDYHAAVFTKWMCAGVARTYDPGHKFDNMLVLEDDEGKGKSRLIRALANGWFTDDFSFGLSSKEVVEQAKGALIIEVQEMSTRSSADVEHIKAFLSRGEERVRMAYARNTGYFPRRWIAAGTTNETAYLKSETGNRRFWCVRGDGREIDVDAVRKVVPQLWAEAKVLYLDYAEPLYLEDKTVLAFAMEQQAARVESDDWRSVILPWLDQKIPKDYWDKAPNTRGDFHDSDELVARDRVSPIEVWVECIRGDVDRFEQRHARRINSILRKAGGWFPEQSVRFGARYGKGRGFKK
jgi:putative DNA primase/helicase